VACGVSRDARSARTTRIKTRCIVKDPTNGDRAMRVQTVGGDARLAPRYCDFPRAVIGQTASTRSLRTA
jgi:hypothetical protein